MLKRLSYANVMATLAFFFALSGGAMAAGKYLLSTDTIASSSDLAGSTYGSPVIAAGKVTTDKIADGSITTAKFAGAAIAPDASKLGGHPVADFARVVTSGTITLAATTFAAGTCTEIHALADVTATDSVIVNPPPGYVGFSVEEAAFPTIGPYPAQVSIGICNVTPDSRFWAGGFHYVVLRG
jgi:hypothetical protein